jgi:hypothetical protein
VRARAGSHGSNVMLNINFVKKHCQRERDRQTDFSLYQLTLKYEMIKKKGIWGELFDKL